MEFLYLKLISKMVGRTKSNQYKKRRTKKK